MRLEIPRYQRVIGLPANGQAIILTNSERSDSACPRRWWFREVERLSGGGSWAMDLGTAWHGLLEHVQRWWMDTDSTFPADGADLCPYCAGRGHANMRDNPEPCGSCGGDGAGALRRIERTVRASALAWNPEAPARGTLSQEDAESLIDTLRRMWEGWIVRYGLGPPKLTQVVGVEVGVAREIVNPRTGRPYCPETYLVREGARYRLAGTGEHSGAQPLPAGAELVTVRWPWYQVGRLDAVLRSRGAGRALYVGEWKSSGDPRGLIEGLTVDPQTAGYCWLLDSEAARAEFGGDRVAGYVYDVASTSYQYDPDPLKAARIPVLDAEGNPQKKGGRNVYELDAAGEPIERIPGLSQSKSRTVPSWRYRDALRRHGFDPREYADHIGYLAQHIDPRLYLREPGTTSREVLDRYSEEVYSDAVRFAAYHREAARARDAVDLNIAFPRIAVCRQPGGRCAFRGPCILDGSDARREFDVSPGLVWVDESREAEGRQEMITW